jgi:hypothetical protein
MKIERITWIIIIILLYLLFIQRECNREEVKPPVPTVEYVYIYDTVEKFVYVDKPIPINIYDTIYLSGTIDTVYVLGDYFKVKVYDDVLVDDSCLYFRLKETVTKNEIIDRSFSYINRRPVGIEIIDVVCPEPLPKLEYYFGGFIGGSQDLFGAGLGIGIRTKTRTFYKYEYDVINKHHRVSGYINLKRKK